MRFLVGTLFAAVPGYVLDDAVESLMDAGSIGYPRTDGTRWYTAAGRADVARREPAESRTRFRIASDTTAFPAAVVLRLVRAKRLSRPRIRGSPRCCLVSRTGAPVRTRVTGR